jgi:signal transduction histidine kinase
LVRSILKRTRASLETITPTFRKERIDRIVQEELDRLPSKMGTKAARLSATSSVPPNTTIDVDRHYLEQALQNVLKNATEAYGDASEEPIVIGVAAKPEKHDTMLALSIADRGIGMTEEERGRVFRRFRSTKPGGSGLGMVITRSIVEAHGGELRIESEKGRGTTVTMLLPRKRSRGRR